MKALLRPTLFALLVFAGYAAVATDLGTSKAGPFSSSTMPKSSGQR